MMRAGSTRLGVPRVPRGFVHAAQARDLTGAPGSMTVLRAPRGWGKTSTVSAWLHSLDSSYDVAWVSLSGPTDAAQFSELVNEQWHRMQLAGDWQRPAQLQPKYAELGRQVVLVIDHSHLLTGSVVDRQLVEAASRNDRLHLVVLGRAERPVELLAQIETGGTFIGVPELRLGGEQVYDVAQSLGVPLTSAEADKISVQVGGWPALVRCLLIAGPERAARIEAVEHYLQIVVADAPAAAALQRAICSAPAAQLNEGTVTALGLGESLAEAVRPLQRAGLTHQGQLSELVRIALARIYAEQDPAGFRAAHERLAEWLEADGDETTALHHALAARAPERLVRLLQRNWLTIATDRALTREAIRMVDGHAPEDVRLHILRRHIGIETTDLSAPAESGDFCAALTTWGLARVRALDLASGEQALREILGRVEHNGGPPEVQRARAALAYARAAAGAVTEARTLLRSCPESAETRQLRRTTQELISLDSLAWDPAVPQYLDAALPQSPDAPLPPDDDALLVASMALARGLSATAAPARNTAVLEKCLHQLGTDRSRELARTSLVAALMSGMLAAGQAAVAQALPGRHLRDPQARLWLTVRAAFYAGNFDQVLNGSEADVLAEANGSAPRMVVERLLLRACALNRMHRAGEAADAFHDAVSLAQTHGLLRPLLLVPRKDLDAMAAATPHLREFLEQLPTSPRPGGLFGLPEVRARLSESELRVLHAIADGVPVTVVAARLFVSVNTVKTQLRAIYRKLGVHNRADAVRRTRERGLLHQEGTPGSQAGPAGKAERL